ncbi:GTPase family protein [Leucothrix arctica]|uniref:GTP-binding protein n=1 Tax=Leucothrix arctica TaxID=1481894 RepID=A0A317C4B0_9GAMM|nr:GTPase [Leucothrix arctica]PWQ93485.1 GTP-binding protein [Leucothrix arctica]
MKKIKGLYRLLSDLSGSRWLIFMISALLPVLTIMGFSFFLAIKYDYILELSIAITVSTLLVTIPLFFLSRKAKQTESETNNEALAPIKDGLVKTSSDWSQAELVIWNHSRTYTRKQLKAGIEWGNIHHEGFEVLDLVAQKFGKKPLEFSIPEGLKLFEEVSRRYKLVVKENIPGIEYIKISHIKAGYEAYDKYGAVGQKVVKAAIWANHAKNLYYNPLKVVSDLTKEQATSSMTKGFVDDMQLMAKEALLDEVAAVAIDLYSGRFSLETEDLQVTSASESDEGNFASALEPIRIVTVGQTGAGKSSIVNLLTDELAAEVDVLPSTQTSTVYDALIDDIEVRLVDLRGLDGIADTEKQMLNEMTQADLILWVLKANQSARDLDKKLNDKLALFYADPKNISYKKPVVIAVVNQVDNLKPMTEWQPPYDLENPDTAKAKTIVQAVAYNQALMNTDIALPLSISPTKMHFGVEALKQTLVDEIVEANNVQRNRQRVEAMKRGVSFKKQFHKTVNVGKKLVRRTLKD